MLQLEQVQGVLRNALLGAAAAALVAGGVGPDAAMPQAQAGIGRPTVTNAKALLRYSLPIDNKPIRKVQRELEAISDELRVPGGCLAVPAGTGADAGGCCAGWRVLGWLAGTGSGAGGCWCWCWRCWDGK
jgi:hypothetical protein